MRGFDYLHEGLNYRYTPVELAPYDYVPVRVKALEAAARRGRRQRAVLVYRNPLDQAASYLRYSRNHNDPAYTVFKGCALSSISLRDYLFGGALASYAKQFISFQHQARRHPGLVQLVPYERLIARPVETLAAILDHLAGAPQERQMLADAVQLARREHMKAIEKEIGRSLDGTRAGRGSHIQRIDADQTVDAATRDAAMAFLQLIGVDTDLFEWPALCDVRASA